MKLEFNVKYGKNVIEIPLPEQTTGPASLKTGLKDVFNAKVTIYNSIPGEGDAPRRFDRFIIEKCHIYGGFANKADGTVQNIVNSQTITTKDVGRYKSPLEYVFLMPEECENYFTAQIGDFIVFGEVDDIITNSKEFAELQQKYKNCGMKITSVSANIYGTSVDNVTMTNA